MNTILLISALALAAYFTSLLLIPVVIKQATKRNLLAQVNHRSSHKIPTPSFGGIGIFMGRLVALPFLDWNTQLLSLIGATVTIFLVGLWDDLKEMKSFTKLFFQLLCALVLYAGGFELNNLNGILGFHELSATSSFALTILFIVGVTNACNLIDGINGLAGTISLINSVVFGTIFIIRGEIEFALIAFTMSGSILGFLKFNFKPAKIFMGDTGSLFLGLLMSVFTIKVFQVSTDSGSEISFATVAIFLPVFDALRLFTQRIKNKKSPFSADKNHLHHWVIGIIPQHHRATLLLGILQLSLLSTAFLHNIISVSILILLCSVLMATFMIAIKAIESIPGFIHSKKMV